MSKITLGCSFKAKTQSKTLLDLRKINYLNTKLCNFCIKRHGKNLQLKVCWWAISVPKAMNWTHTFPGPLSLTGSLAEWWPGLDHLMLGHPPTYDWWHQFLNLCIICLYWRIFWPGAPPPSCLGGGGGLAVIPMSYPTPQQYNNVRLFNF